ncbi:MAG: hypothetical protein HFG04_09575 [Oscillibacter sp.]|nr:hypothetical protein [Oscillibacter sp.]
MFYSVAKELFEKLPQACFGVVAVRGVDNHAGIPEIRAFLQEGISRQEAYFEGKPVKTDPHIEPYREAFRTLQINPNKYLCSIEALLSRIAKKKGFPTINPIVDLGNAVSLRHFLPIGAHDLGTIPEGLEVRPAVEGDFFLPFGGEGMETPDAGEIVYVSEHQVRTRRWTWRQSEIGKITEETSSVLFPIDGFSDINGEEVRRAAAELAECVERFFHVSCEVGFVDADHPRVDFFV